MDNSFIKLHRRILKWEWYTDPNMFHFFLHLLLKASFKDGRYRGVDVKKGQLVTGRIELATDTGLSEMQIRTCIKKLKSTNEITTFATNKYTIITVCKYDSYQDNKVDSNQQNNQLRNQRTTNEQPTSNQRVTTIEEGLIREEGKEIKNWEYEKNNFLKDEGWMYKFCTEKSISLIPLKKLMTDFISEIELKEDQKTSKELKSHFTNTYNLNKKNESKSGFSYQQERSTSAPLTRVN